MVSSWRAYFSGPPNRSTVSIFTVYHYYELVKS